MKDERIYFRVDGKAKKAFQKKVGKRNVSSVLSKIVDNINKSKKRFDNNDTHLFI